MGKGRPVLAINYKTYPTSIGSKALEIAKHVEKRVEETGIVGIVAVPYTMIQRISSSSNGKLLVYAQHVDPLEPGRGTGYVTVEMIKEAGAQGSILNHSEHTLKLSEIVTLVEKLHSSGLESMVCADTPKSALAVSVLEPTYLAVEPPELIGTGVSVTRAKPEIITSSLELVRERAGYKGYFLVGAGVSTGEDAKKSLELGADGVLLASAVMKAKDPRAKIDELIDGLLSRI